MLARADFRPRHRNAGRPAHKVAASFLQWLRGRACLLAPTGECEGKVEACHYDRYGDKGMGLVSKAAKGNRATTRTEYDAYRAKARELGYQSMATAAALAFEGCQRAWDVFGYEDPDGVKHRGFLWDDYTDETVSLVQSKTGNLVTLPLALAGTPRVSLYPDLEEEIARARVARREGVDVIVVEERSGQKYKERRMSSVHRAICEAAGLPKDMTFTGFRHGGITEVGSVTADVRPISGHATLDVTRIYNKVTADKAREIAAARRAHVQLITGDVENGNKPA